MISNETIAAIRKDYTLKQFDESHLIKNPFDQFRAWFKEAIDAEVNEPNAMTLATCKENGRPTARVVLLKGIEEHGFVFFTNYESHKGTEIAKNPYAALVFFWPELQRQIRIEGEIKKLDEAASDAYFFSRPIESQIGAHASPQSCTIESRQVIEDNYKRLLKRFETDPISRPANWGGYSLDPQSIEFWQGRASRLHDRFLFTKAKIKDWNVSRLAP